MRPNSPMPPIASGWLKYRHPCAEGWATSYTTNLVAFEELFSNVASQDTIDLNTP